MAYLGVPYRIAYIGKNFRTGLTDVISMILKPDGSVVGPFPMTESTGLGFSGIYVYDFHSDTELDREGEYLAQMISPTENNRGPLRFTLERRQFFPYGDRILMLRPDPSTVAMSANGNLFSVNQSQINFQPATCDVEMAPVNSGNSAIGFQGATPCLDITMDENED